MEEQVAYPEWTDYKKKQGLDPLGMQNSSIVLYQNLLPGIGNVTLRMRYYGLYAWLTWIYAKRVHDKNPKNWQRFLRRAEAIYALLSQSEIKETGVAGVNWANKKLNEINGETIDVASGADIEASETYFKQAWGVYGLAYGSQLFQIGILENVEDHEIPVPTKNFGEPLANALANELPNVLDLYYDIIERGVITRQELKSLFPLLPSEIQKDSEECRLYKEILFADSEFLQQAENQSRRNTLLIVLAITKQLGMKPSAADLRWAFYTGCTTETNTLDLKTDTLLDQQKLWSIYQVNDLLHFAYGALLKFVLDILDDYKDGITLNALVSECVLQIINFKETLPINWQQYLEQVGSPDDTWDLNDPKSEFGLFNQISATTGLSKKCLPDTAWNALTLLAVLHNRTLKEDRKLELDFSMDANLFRSIRTEKQFLDTHANEDFRELLVKLIKSRIIERHMWVAHKKFRYQSDYTFLIEAEDGKVRVRAKDSPGFTNPRLSSALNFLHDIKVIDDNGLTDSGSRVLEAA